MMIKLIIADDHQMFIDGVKSILKPEKDISLIGEALNGQQLIDQLYEYQPDLILMDINMPEMNGIEATRTIKTEFPGVKIIVLTMYNERGFITKLLENGADGYVLKDAGKQELVEAIQKVSEGQSFYSQDVMKEVMRGLKSENMEDDIVLTKREIEIIELIVQECTTDEIAEKLFISHHTVESHRKNILSKTGSKNTAGLVKFAFQNGIVESK